MKPCPTCDQPNIDQGGDYWLVFKCSDCGAVVEQAERTVLGWPLSFHSRDTGEIVSPAA